MGLFLFNVGLQSLLLRWSIPLSLLLRHWLGAAGLAGLILVLACEGGGLSRGLRWSPLLLLGEISYSLYLFHRLVLQIVVNAHPMVLAWMPAVLRFPAVLLASLVISFAAWNWLEKPARLYWLQAKRVQLPR
jgi:peptidoglycan/LPS O-acetylase OafA/YrhL